MNWQKLLDDSVHEIRATAPVKCFRDPVLYGKWLSQTYHFVCHSTALLGYSLPFIRDERLKEIYEHHLGEESRHDLLALKDLEMLCQSPEPVSPMTEAFYQTQYYRIQFQSGEALLGYILFLENLAVTWGQELYLEMKTTHPRSVLFLKVHAEEDISHVARARELIESMDEGAQDILAANFLASSSLYRGILCELLFQVQRKVA